jgi:hypothetical protein
MEIKRSRGENLEIVGILKKSSKIFPASSKNS